MRCTRWNHREAIFFLVNNAVKQDRFVNCDHFMDGIIKITRRRHANTMSTIGFGQLRVIGLAEMVDGLVLGDRISPCLDRVELRWDEGGGRRASAT